MKGYYEPGKVCYTPGMNTTDIAIIYQDHHLLLVNKPAGIVIHPTYKHADGTLWDALLSYTQQLGPDDWQPSALPDDPAWAAAPPAIQQMLRDQRTARLWQEEGQLPRPCLLHRLDKDTSGIVALARTERARRHIVRQFQDHSIVKRYLALVQAGAYTWSQPRTTFTVTRKLAAGQEFPADDDNAFSLSARDEFLLDGPLQRDPADRRRCIVGPEGQPAATCIRVLAVERGYALLDVRPISGRTHQIRTHLAALGYAIVGDQTYAPVIDRPETLLTRQFLHAYSLKLQRYPDNEQVTFAAPLAPDLLTWLEAYCPLLWQVWQSLYMLSLQEYSISAS